MSPSKNNKKRLFIIDGYATLYRAHYALIRNPLTTTAGIPTSAVFGFANQVFQLLEEENPDYIVAAFDSKGKNKKSLGTNTLDKFQPYQKADIFSNDEEYVKSEDTINEERKFPEKLDEENTKSKDIPEFFLDREKESEENKE